MVIRAVIDLIVFASGIFDFAHKYLFLSITALDQTNCSALLILWSLSITFEDKITKTALTYLKNESCIIYSITKLHNYEDMKNGSKFIN